MSLSPSRSAGPHHYDEPVARSGVGLVVLLVRAWPSWRRGLLMGLGGVGLGGVIWRRSASS